MSEDIEQAKTQPAGKKNNKNSKRANNNRPMAQNLGELLRNTPGFEKLPKYRKFKNGTQKNHKQV